MPVIAIVGTSGVGKSFLVRQLAAITSFPAFFEGEEGSIPQKVFLSIMHGTNPMAHWKFFIERRRHMLVAARQISNKKFTCFVDGGVITAQAILSCEQKKFHHPLLRLIKTIDHLAPDVNVVLTSNAKRLEENIFQRRRKFETNHEALQYALRLQEEFLRLARSTPKTIIIDRTLLDFTDIKDVSFVLKRIQKIVST